MVLILALVSQAWPCGAPFLEGHEVTANPLDVEPPAVPSARVDGIGRGAGPQCKGGECVASSCDDIGIVVLVVSSDDDVSPPETIGYDLSIVEGGTLPDGFHLPPDVRAEDDGEIPITWGDQASDEQEAFAFEIDVRAVDEAGNVSEPTRLVVEHEGTTADEMSCSTAAGGGIPGMLALLGVLSVHRRRRPR